MSESNGGRRRFAAIGGVGCVAVVALPIFISPLTFGIAWFQAQGVGVSRQGLARDLPAREVAVDDHAGELESRDRRRRLT